MVEVEEVVVLLIVKGLRADTVAGEELLLLELLKLLGLVEVEDVAAIFVVEGLRADTVAGEELLLLKLLKLLRMQLELVPQ